MKNLNKVLAMVLALAMLFSMSAFAYSDISEDASYAEAVTMLSELGIIAGYPDGTFGPDNTITRAEVTKLLVAALGAEDQALGMAGANIFADVPADHWAAGYINYAASFGIVLGMGDGTFQPDAPVTYEQVVKMIVAMLGYTPMADAKGKYPSGYLYVANQEIKITKGAVGDVGQPATRWMVARLLFNALEVRMMEQEDWGSDPTFVVPKVNYKTLLADYLEVTKVEGIVTETYLQAATVDKENQYIKVKVSAVDGDKDHDDVATVQTIDTADKEVANLLGYSVTAYVKDYNENTEELVAIAAKSDKNKTLKLNADDFEETTATSGVVVKDNGEMTIEYYATADAKKVTTAKIDKNVKYFVNDVENTTADALQDAFESFDQDYNNDVTLTLIDNDADGKYDYVLQEQVKADYVVESINAKNSRITDAITNKTVLLDADDEDMYLVFVKDGKEVDFDAIAKEDVLSVVYNRTTLNASTVVKVYISSEQVEGYIASGDATKNNWKIDGETYKATTAYKNNLTRGDEGVFYLNVNGKIVYADTTESVSGNYAFLLAAGTETKFTSGTTVTFIFMDEDGKWQEATLADKATFAYYEDNEQTSEKISEVEDIEEEDALSDMTNGWLTYDDGDIEIAEGNRVFQYEMNSKNELTKVIVPQLDGFDDDAFSGVAFSEAVYDADNNRFISSDVRNKGGVAESTIVFQTKVDEPTKKSEVTLGSYATFQDDNSYEGYAFDNKSGDFACMVLVGATSLIAEDAPLMVLTEDVGLMFNKDTDIEYYTVAGFVNGEEVSYESVDKTDVDCKDYDDDDYDPKDLEAGDIVRVALDEDGKVTLIELVMAADDADDSAWYDKDGDVEEYYGYLKSQTLSGSAQGVKLYEYIDSDESDYLGDVIATAGKNMLGTVYLVDKTARTLTVTAGESVADYTGAIDEEAEFDPTDNAVVYYAYALVVDGQTVDIVIFAIDATADMYTPVASPSAAPAASPSAAPAASPSAAPTESPEIDGTDYSTPDME